MQRLQFILTAGLGLLLASGPARSHHSFAAEFDNTKPVTFTGRVARIEWFNPHAYLYVEVVDADTADVVTWSVELGSPNGLRRLGWRRDTVKVGDEIIIEGWQGRFRPNLANARVATLTGTGQKLGADSSEGTTP